MIWHLSEREIIKRQLVATADNMSMLFFSLLSFPSYPLALQQNSITLILPYNHFSSPRLDSFPALTGKSLITLWPWLSRSFSLSLPWSHSSCTASLPMSTPQHANTCSNFELQTHWQHVHIGTFVREPFTTACAQTLTHTNMNWFHANSWETLSLPSKPHNTGF